MTPDLHSYDFILVAFSGGKDSAACVFRLLDEGAPPERIELWHHDIDGREGPRLFDWPCTRGYVRRFAEDFGLKLYYSWREGGFEREMLRENTPTAQVLFEGPEGLSQVGGKGPPNTRMRFPQVSADLNVRWCSAYLKIDVMARALANDPRFDRARTLVLSGERAGEDKSKKGTGRASYATFEKHRTDLRGGRVPRHIDHWRPVHAWSEEQVWDAMQRYRVNPHPAYRLGYNRVSCATCIFGSPDQWASARFLLRDQFTRIADFEAAFGERWARSGRTATIQRNETVVERADRGEIFQACLNEAVRAEVDDEEWSGHVILPEGVEWELPAGAFGDSTGPT